MIHLRTKTPTNVMIIRLCHLIVLTTRSMILGHRRLLLLTTRNGWTNPSLRSAVGGVVGVVLAVGVLVVLAVGVLGVDKGRLLHRHGCGLRVRASFPRTPILMKPCMALASAQNFHETLTLPPVNYSRVFSTRRSCSLSYKRQTNNMTSKSILALKMLVGI